MNILSKYKSRFNEMWVFDSSPVEFGCGSALVLWGALLANPLTTTYLQNRAYWFISSGTGHEEVAWGLAAVMCGLLQCLAVLFNKRGARRWLSLGSFMWWFFLSVSFIQTDILPATGVYLVEAVQSAWCFMRLKR